MTVFVRPAREEDAEKFADWFVKTETFDIDAFQFPETYTLCAFSPKKILGFLVVRFNEDVQYLHRFIPNPEASNLEQASAAAELVKSAITTGFIRGIPHIYFLGNHSGTNRIASHIFSVEPNEGQEFPMHRLTLKDIECQASYLP